MTANSAHIYPVFDRMVPRVQRETRLGQRGLVVWLYGLSGSGKSTIAYTLEHRLFAEGRFAQVLDGDNIRTGLNRDLGFSDADRLENIRRIAEVAKLYAHSGVITLCSFITPHAVLRTLAREIIGETDFLEVYVKCSYAQCAARDPKGLYAKVQRGEVKAFTGKDSAFEEPTNAEFILDTESSTIEASVENLHQIIRKKFVL